MTYTLDKLIFLAIGGWEMLKLFHWILDYYHPAGYVHDMQPPNQNWFLLFKQPVTFCLESGIMEVPADYCILYTAGVRRRYYNNTTGYYHDGIFFQGEEVPELAEALGIPCNTPFPIKRYTQANSARYNPIIPHSYILE